MTDTIKGPEQGGEDLLAVEIADEALEAAAGRSKARFHHDWISDRQHPGRVLRLMATLRRRNRGVITHVPLTLTYCGAAIWSLLGTSGHRATIEIGRP